MTKINITVPEEFLLKIDRTAKDERLTRSEFLRKAVESFWEAKQKEKADQQRMKRIKTAMGVQEELRLKSGTWDGVQEIRMWRDAR